TRIYLWKTLEDAVRGVIVIAESASVDKFVECNGSQDVRSHCTESARCVDLWSGGQDDKRLEDLPLTSVRIGEGKPVEVGRIHRERL
ncbi:hypothetical protein D6833_08205, partial [Candidatus Parcubacteria bacterium]